MSEYTQSSRNYYYYRRPIGDWHTWSKTQRRPTCQIGDQSETDMPTRRPMRNQHAWSETHRRPRHDLSETHLKPTCISVSDNNNICVSSYTQTYLSHLFQRLIKHFFYFVPKLDCSGRPGPPGMPGKPGVQGFPVNINNNNNIIIKIIISKHVISLYTFFY